jgi:hypothetical protein
MIRTCRFETLRHAQGERIKEKPFVVRLSNHERLTPFNCYSSLEVRTTPFHNIQKFRRQETDPVS